jgi:hypothetical protein
MKKLIVLLMVLTVIGAHAGQVDLPVIRLSLPAVQGDYLVCVWDAAAKDWHADFSSYDHKGTVDFQVPQEGKWYWVGLWDQTDSEYIYGKWISHFEADSSQKSLNSLKRKTSKTHTPPPAN